MHTNPTAATSGETPVEIDLMVSFDDLCALARDGIKAGDFDITTAALAAAVQTADEIKARRWAAERLDYIRQTAQSTAVAS